jgi:hypothetical protein
LSFFLAGESKETGKPIVRTAVRRDLQKTCMLSRCPHQDCCVRCWIHMAKKKLDFLKKKKKKTELNITLHKADFNTVWQGKYRLSFWANPGSPMFCCQIQKSQTTFAVRTAVTHLHLHSFVMNCTACGRGKKGSGRYRTRKQEKKKQALGLMTQALFLSVLTLVQLEGGGHTSLLIYN